MAKRFVFRLEAVRRLRKQEVEREQRAVAEAVRRVREMEKHLADLDRELRDTLVAGRGYQERPTLDLGVLRSYQVHGGWLRMQMMRSREELSRRERDTEQQRAKLIEANKRLKVIEKLRERHATRYRETLNREEQAETDEAGTQRFLQAPVRA